MTEYGKIHTDGSRSGGQPLDDSIEAKAFALMKQVRREHPNAPDYTSCHIAICRAIEQHEATKLENEQLLHDLERQMTIANEHVDEVEAYKQKVGDIASAYNKMAFTVTEPHLSGYRVIIGFDKHADASMCHDRLVSLLDFLNPKPKPDPLVDVAKSLGYFNTIAQHWAGDVRAALDALGFEIREKGQ